MTDATPGDGTELPDDPHRPRIAWWVTAGAVLLIVIVVVAIALGVPRPDGDDSELTAGSASPSATASAEPTASPAPSEEEPGASTVPDAEASTPVDDADDAVGDGSGERPTPTTVAIDDTAALGNGAEVRIDRLESIQGEAVAPGEIAGDAIRFAVTIVNTTAESIDTGTTTVTVDYGTDRTPATQLSSPGGAPLDGSIAPGASAEGTYIFTVPADSRDSVTITVDYAVDVPPLEFEGAAP